MFAAVENSIFAQIVFASRANFIVIKFVAKAQNFKILPPLAFGAEHK